MVETYVKRAEDMEGTNANLIPGLLEAILVDYSSNVPAARDAEVLNLMATIFGVLGVSITILDQRSPAEEDTSPRLYSVTKYLRS